MLHKIIQNLSHKARRDNMLQKLCDKLRQEFGLTPVVGAEIEFYVMGVDDSFLYNEFQDIIIKPEKGRNQFEIDIFPQETVIKTIDSISRAKACLLSFPGISLHPKPYPHDYGSAMHFHINFLDSSGNNCFDNMDHLYGASQSLCHFLEKHFLIFAPNKDHYTRFSKDFMAPTRICFGGNNRSVAIRIPAAKPRRIEHRVSSPETDEYLAICAILIAMYEGLKHPCEITSYEKIHGNAFDAQYDLVDFPKDIEDALKKFRFFYLG